MVVELVQLPWVDGVSDGMLWPSALLTGLLNVSWIGVLALIVGRATGTRWRGVEPGGNQLTSCGCRVSHVRGAAAT